LQLNQGTLPANYRALPRSHIGPNIEIDVATLRVAEEEQQAGNGLATAVWAPPQTRLVAAVDFTDRDAIEVRIQETTRRRLVAAVELVSPGNKDRPSVRHDFLVKCASYLQERVSIVVIDVVTERRANLHRELMESLDLPEDLIEAVNSPLYAVSYRLRLREDKRHQLELWPHELTVGAALPTVPLWIAEDRAVPLELETSYRAACQTVGLH
jgi:hypothetical protein